MGVTTVSNSLILGGRVTKVLKNGVTNKGVEGWVTTIFDFFMLMARQKNATLKNCILGNFFLFLFVKFRNSQTSLLA